MAESLIESGVAGIEVAASQSFNRTYKPVGGKVKWFTAMDRLWFKFDVRDAHVWDADINLVFLAERLVCVVYEGHSLNGATLSEGGSGHAWSGVAKWIEEVEVYEALCDCGKTFRRRNQAAAVEAITDHLSRYSEGKVG